MDKGSMGSGRITGMRQSGFELPAYNTGKMDRMFSVPSGRGPEK